MSSHNVETVNKFIKTYNAHAELLFCLLNDLYQENMRIAEWGPVYIEKNFPGVTLPAPVNLSKCLYEKWLTPLRKSRAENSARAWSDSLALTELTRLCKPSVFLEKSRLS